MPRAKFPLWLWAVPVAFLAFFFFYPLFAVFHLAGKSALVDGLAFFSWNRVWQPLSFTFYQAAISTILTLLLGLPAAYVFARYSFKGKRLLGTLTTIPFILPTVVAAASFSAMLGPRGLINVVLIQLFDMPAPPLDILNSLPAILLAHVFYNTAIIIRVVGNAWSQLDARLEHAGRVLGASAPRVLWQITLPLLKPAILAASALVFLFDFTSFGVILLLGGPRFSTLEVEIYIQALQMLNLPLAGLLSAIQLACTLVLTVLYLRLGSQGAVEITPRLKGEGQRKPRRWQERLLVWGMVAVLVAILVLPLTALGIRSVSKLHADRGQRQPVTSSLTLAYYRELFINRRGSLFYVPPVAAARNSLLYAGATVGLSLTLGLLVVYALDRPSLANRWLEPALMLPLGTSAVTLGLGFIIVFNRPPLDARSFPFLVPIAHSLVALPVVVRILKPALSSIPDSLRQAAAVLGASPWRVWREVDWPIMGRAAVIAGIFSFTISLGEFGATSFLSRPEYPTMPVAIFRFLSQPGALNYGQAMAMATLLLLVCGISILLVDRL